MASPSPPAQRITVSAGRENYTPTLRKSGKSRLPTGLEAILLHP
jgi:hypothetical protein